MIKPSVRNHNGELQVATHEYINPHTHRTFVLVGVAHIAESHFWESLATFLDQRGFSHQFEIHYEMVKRGGTPTPLEDQLYVRMAKLLGLQSQNEGLPVQEHWINTDTTADHLMKLAKEHGVGDELRELLAKMDRPLDLDSVPDWGVRLVRWLLRHPRVVERAPFGMSKALKSVILDERSDYAMWQMLQRAEDGVNVITVWGAGHLPQMEMHLQLAGYQCFKTTWHTAVER